MFFILEIQANHTIAILEAYRNGGLKAKKWKTVVPEEAVMKLWFVIWSGDHGMTDKIS